MATEIATTKQDGASRLMDAVYESVALRGDISGLKPAEKVAYVRQFCERLGLDPSTVPFPILKLNGKETLYASKGATDQLAKLHNVTRKVLSRETVQDCYVVTTRATLPNGREEDSIGAVTIAGLKGDAFANALMKSETKSKRRATLSILGLGLLDESELESIPAAAMAEAPAQRSIPPAPPAPSGGDRITGEQRARLAKLIRDLNAYGIANENLQAKLEAMAGVSKSADLTPAQAEEVIGVFSNWNATLVEAAAENAKSEEVKNDKSVPF